MKAYFKRLFEDFLIAVAPEEYAFKLVRERMERED